MKKYFIASVVAVMAFAFAAFAASLTVNAPNLQAGQATDLKCVDEINVTAWGYNDYTGKALNVELTPVNNECKDGEFLYVTLLDEQGNRLMSVGGHDSEAYVVQNFGDNRGDAPFRVNLFRGPELTTSGVDAGVIGGIRIGIDQGF